MRKRPAAAEPIITRKTKRANDVAVMGVCSTWSVSDRTTLASLRDEFAKSVGADPRDKITVASFGAEVSPVLGLAGFFPNMSYVAALVRKRSQAAPQLVSRDICAAHVFAAGEPICLRHGRRCSLQDSGPVDLLVADGAADLPLLV